jgi:hypothetical protein
LPLTLYT